MDYKEKYEQALERCKKEFNFNNLVYSHEEIKQRLERVFPELKESEDEKIRRALIQHIKYKVSVISGWRKEELIAWLEKQGEKKPTSPVWKYKKDHTPLIRDSLILNKYGCVAESPSGTLVSDVWVIDYDELTKLPKEEIEKHGEQKPTNNVEQKFHEGDWITIDNPCKIISIDGNYIVQYCDDEKTREISKKFCESKFHLWTIQDAKDGDVLCCENGWTCIFKTLVNDETFGSYCFMDNTKWFCETGSECHTLKEEFVKAYNGKIYPATKEQCDLLFQKMEEAGYEWDSEKKELKKVEKKPAWSEEDYNEIGVIACHLDNMGNEAMANSLLCIRDKYNVKPKQKYEWSEKDEGMCIFTIKILNGIHYKDNANWLKSLKERMKGE